MKTKIVCLVTGSMMLAEAFVPPLSLHPKPKLSFQKKFRLAGTSDDKEKQQAKKVSDLLHSNEGVSQGDEHIGNHHGSEPQRKPMKTQGDEHIGDHKAKHSTAEEDLRKQTTGSPRYFDENADDNAAQGVNEEARSVREGHGEDASDFLFKTSDSKDDTTDTGGRHPNAEEVRRNQMGSASASRSSKQHSDDEQQSGERYFDENADDNAAQGVNQQSRSARQHEDDSQGSDFLYKQRTDGDHKDSEASADSSSSSSSGSTAPSLYRYSRDRLQHKVDRVIDKAQEPGHSSDDTSVEDVQRAKQQASDSAAAGADAVKDKAEAAASTTKETAHKASEQAEHEASGVIDKLKSSSLAHAAQDVTAATKKKSKQALESVKGGLSKAKDVITGNDSDEEDGGTSSGTSDSDVDSIMDETSSSDTETGNDMDAADDDEITAA